MNEAIIEKVRRLRALATSSNVHEAAAAAAAAERIIQEYKLAEAELCANEGAVDEAVSLADEALASWSGRRQPWLQILANGIARSHDCRTVSQVIPAFGGYGGGKIVIVGRSSDVATVRYLFAWLQVEIQRLGAAHCRAGAARNAFLLGATTGVTHAMFEAKRRAMSTAGASVSQSTRSAAIVLQSRGAASDLALRRFFPHLKNSSKVRISHGDSYRRGVEVGRNLHTGKALGSGVRALPAKTG